ncbi:MAG: IS66 family insertion sequence element accessory protein TnpA, partial [Bacteroidota bacterium]
MARTSTGGTPRLSKSALMQQHLQAWKHSGLSQRAYLDTTGVSKTLFSYWQRKLSPELSPTV